MNSLIMCILNICKKSLIRDICGLATTIDEVEKKSSSLLGILCELQWRLESAPDDTKSPFDWDL